MSLPANERSLKGRQSARAYGSKSVDFSGPGIYQLADENNSAIHYPSLSEEICLPPYQFVKCSPAERQVYDHPALQRLRRVAQLGGADLVFPAAEHSRFPHSLGVLESAARLMDCIDDNILDRSLKPTPGENRWNLAEGFTPEEQILVRLAALVHDIGHIPFGHTLEDELGLIRHHDDVERFTEAASLDTYRVLGREVRETPRSSHSTQRSFYEGSLADLIQKLYGPVVRRVLNGAPISNTSVLGLVIDLVARDAKPVPEKYNRSRFRVLLCRELLVGPMSADVIDYIPRDKMASGVDAGNYNPRLLQYLVPLIPANDPAAQPRLVIDLGTKRRVKTDAITAAHGLLEARFELTQVLYRHPVKCAASAMLDRVLGELAAQGIMNDEDFKNFTRTLLQQFADEDRAMSLLVIKALGPPGTETPKDIEEVLELLELLILRRLHKTEISLSPAVGKAVFDRAVGRYSGKEGRIDRIRLARCLERDFGLIAGDVVVYSSGPRPALKHPNFMFALDGEAVSLSAVRSANGATAAAINELIGEYFEAQQARFSSIGRLEILVSSAAVAALEGAQLRGLFNEVALKALGAYNEKADSGAWQAYSEYITSRRGLAKHTGLVRAARGGDRLTLEMYPNGMPTLTQAEE